MNSYPMNSTPFGKSPSSTPFRSPSFGRSTSASGTDGGHRGTGQAGARTSMSGTIDVNAAGPSGYSVYDSSVQTPKTVRWEDAPSFPLHQQQQHQQQQQQHQSSPFQQQYQQQQYRQPLSSSQHHASNSTPSQQPMQPQNQSSSLFGGMRSGFASSSPSIPQTNTNPYQLNGGDNQASQTPLSRPAFASYPSSSSSLALTNRTFGAPSVQPNASSAFSHSPSSSSQLQVSRSSQKSGSIADITRPIAVSSLSARAVAPAFSKPTSAAVQPSSAASAATPSPGQAADAVITPRSAIVRRIKWNIIVLLLNWTIVWFGPLRNAYWLLLSASFTIFGGDADVHLANTLSWTRSALFILTIVNISEAVIRLQTTGHASVSTNALVAGGANGGQKRKPSLAHPPTRAVSSSSPSPSSSSPLQAHSSPSATSKRTTPRHYAQASPLRESIFRASLSAQQATQGRRSGGFEGLYDESGHLSSSSLSLGQGRRVPSQTPSRFEHIGVEASVRKSSPSPAAAFLAQRSQRGPSGGEGAFAASASFGANDSFDDSAADLSADSINVSRAIRALSASYGREMSQAYPTASTSVSRNEGLAA